MWRDIKPVCLELHRLSGALSHRAGEQCFGISFSRFRNARWGVPQAPQPPASAFGRTRLTAWLCRSRSSLIPAHSRGKIEARFPVPHPRRLLYRPAHLSIWETLIKEALIISTCAPGEQILCPPRRKNRRNTLCISRFLEHSCARGPAATRRARIPLRGAKFAARRARGFIQRFLWKKQTPDSAVRGLPAPCGFFMLAVLQRGICRFERKDKTGPRDGAPVRSKPGSSREEEDFQNWHGICIMIGQ